MSKPLTFDKWYKSMEGFDIIPSYAWDARQPEIDALTRERDAARAACAEMRSILEIALNDTGCDGELCSHTWHNLVRELRDSPTTKGDPHERS